MASSKQGITVRFEDDEMKAIDELAKRFRVSSATIIRWAIQALNEYVQQNQGRITLPLDFSEYFAPISKRIELKVAEDEGRRGDISERQSVRYPKSKRQAK